LSTYIVVVDDEPDVESMFRQHFRRELRSGRFVMEFALSAPAGLEQVKAIPDPSLILILSDINMPGMTGLEMLPKVKAARPNVPVIMITAYGDDATRKSYRTRSSRVASKAHRLWLVAPRNRSAVGRVSLRLLLARTDTAGPVGDVGSQG
jgi:CheY-like chemotaxis protein